MNQQNLFEIETPTPEIKEPIFVARVQENFYKEYLASTQWKKKRKQVLERAKYRCEKCKIPKDRLEVHHLTYDRLGREDLHDLLAVCQDCHKVEDKLRAQRTESNRYWQAVDSFAEKKYGEGWEDWKDSETVGEEFDNWLERKSYDY